MTSLFLCCYFCATGLCQDATRLGDHRGVTLAWLWFLDQALGSRLGVHCKYFFFSSFPSFISLVQQNCPTPLHWDCGNCATLYSKLTVSFLQWNPPPKKQANNHTNIYIHMCSTWFCPTVPASFVPYSICCVHLLLWWSLARSWNTCPKISKVHVEMIKASLLWLKQSKHPSGAHRKTHKTGCLSLS